MAYKPPQELRGRIDKIKRKFEVPPNTSATAAVSSGLNKDTHSSVVFVNRVKPSIADKSNIQLRETARIEESNHRISSEENQSKPHKKTLGISVNKSNIRRTPAFRCDKSVKARNVVQSCTSRNKQKSESQEENYENRNDVRTVIQRLNSLPINPSRDPVVFLRKDTKGNYQKITDDLCFNSQQIKSNLLSNIELKNREAHDTTPAAILATYSKVSKTPPKNLDTQVKPQEQNDVRSENSFIVQNTKQVKEYQSDSTKNLRNEISDCNSLRIVDSSLTNSLKLALKNPLPDGPPPKKPPRTFAHTSTEHNVNNESVSDKVSLLKLNFEKQNLNSKFAQTGMSLHKSYGKTIPPRKEIKPIRHVRSKTEPHIMLQKIETALINHQQGKNGKLLVPSSVKPDLECYGKISRKHSSDFSNNLSIDSETAERRNKVENTAVLGGCLNSLSCVSGSNLAFHSGHFYEKLLENQSTFFVDINLNENQLNNKLYGTLHKSHSEEHIYAEPFCFQNGNCSREKLVNGLERLGKLTKNSSASLENLDYSKAYIDGTPPSRSLHYMCNPIPLDLKSPTSFENSATTHKASTVSYDKDPVQDTQNTDEIDCTQTVTEAVNHHVSPLLRLAALVKSTAVNSSEETPPIDRTRIQLVMNQAFGTPLQGIPQQEGIEGILDHESRPSTPDGSCEPYNFSHETNSNNVLKDVIEPEESDFKQTENNLSVLTEQRKVYVRRVSSRVFPTSRTTATSESFSHLFHCILLLGLNLDSEKRIKVPYIKSKYPPHAEIPPLIEHLCFPDAINWPPPAFLSDVGSVLDEQSYSVVITNEIGEHKYGYCRRVKPEGAAICLPLAYCIISSFKARGFYFKVLNELESRHGQAEWLQSAFIKELYNCEFPEPGEHLKLNAARKGGPLDTGLVTNIAKNLRRPVDSRLEENDLTVLLSVITVPVLLQVFGSVLLERKILLLSSSISKLSACIEGLQSIIYPFSWQYTLVSVLPSMKIDVCEAPTPYIIGILKDRSGELPSVTVDEGIIVDLEESKVIKGVGDESTILPSRLKRCLKVALQLVESTTQYNESSRNVLIAEAFLRMFVEVCGHYQNHIVTQQDGKKVFERESFIKALPSHNIQLFLEWFAETAMFSVFIETRLSNSEETKGIFEQRVMEHSDEMDKNTMLFLRNYKAINKKVKTLGDRLKDWTTFS